MRCPSRRPGTVTGVSDPTAQATAGPSTAVEPAPPAQPAVTDPAKLIRLGTMLQALLGEVRESMPDESGRARLAQIHGETMEQLAGILSPELMAELQEFSDCCGDDGVPSAGEIRVAQAQLVGWLQGLLQGMQAAAFAHAGQAQQHLEQVARPGGPGPGPGAGPDASPRRTGYL